MRRLSFLFALGAALVFINHPLFSSVGEEEEGTLIVTYKTDTRGERLDRIRFWLKEKSSSKQTLYPKGKAFVDDHEDPSRMVVIENLPAGDYILRFLVPNIDRYFQEVPNREVTILAGDVVKLDQQIKPLGSAKTLSVDAAHQPPENDTSPSKSETAENEKEEEEEEEEAPDETFEEPEQRKSDSAGFGKLIISYEIPDPAISHETVCFRLVTPSGEASDHPAVGEDTEVPLKSGKMVMISSIPSGNYTIEFFDEEDGSVIHKLTDIRIDTDKTRSIHESLPHSQLAEAAEEQPENVAEEAENVPEDLPTTPVEDEAELEEEPAPDKAPTEERAYEISVTANIPTAIFRLKDADNTIMWEGEGRLHTFQGLPAGKYTLNFQSSDPFFVPPESLVIDLENDEDVACEAVFQTLGKLKVLSNINRAKAEVRDIDHQASQSVDIIGGVGVAYLPEGEYRVSFEALDAARKSPHPMEVAIHSLQTKEVHAYFEAGWRGAKKNSR